MSKKKNTERFLNTAGLYLITIAGTLAGFLLMVVSPYIPPLETVLNTLGQLAITISVGSLFMEWFGYVNYIRKRMCEILIEDEVINVLDLNRKKELKSALIKNIYMNNAPQLQNEENNIATIIDNEMDNILQDYYFEECIMYIDASFEPQNGSTYLKKKIRQTFTARTINKQWCTLESPISTYFSPPETDDEPLCLKKFCINNVPQDIASWKISTKPNTKEMKETYNSHYTLESVIAENKDLFSFNDKIDIDLEYTTLVPSDDLVFTYQIRKACKHFCIHFNVPPEYKLLVEGFGFMSLGNTMRQRLIETDNGSMLRFLDWILPGNGVMFVIQPKQQKITENNSNES